PQLPPTDDEVREYRLSRQMLDSMGGGLPAMMKLVDKTPLATLKAVMAAHFLSNHAAVLPADIDTAHFEFFGKLLRGQEEQRPRWKRAIDAVEGQLGEQLGQPYVARHFPPESNAAMDDLVANLRKAMAHGLHDNDWMTH